ncbi:hypothetical protein VCUG_01290 [Vavraia culicis subsp. floridensis]|uniref:Exocyst complex component Sec3 C-terminal domain-containing protein n=1 Tax=Vavraia culicis (isolate floridensis) TaxID=948595 RepID=L2GVQ1_VAVCU|nr:uncharacterized protein VCUG_01290 [Vavraia culicis subsp. floridensis]ELA47190.1 hypothetical protein VCUG_01290 [Vavraia culicis subsp. floridensis]
MSDSLSSETASSDHMTSNEVFAEESFDPLLFINSALREHTLGGLNDTLANVKESISRNKIKNQELVRRHFSKFVHCRESIEEIRKNDVFSYVKNVFEQIEHNLTALKDKIRQISLSHGISAHLSDESTRRREILHYYDKLINLEDRLKYDLKYLDYEGFVKHYNSAAKLKNDSKFLSTKLRQANIVKNRFLDILVAEIEKNGSTEDTLFYFKLYFKIERDEHSKMENTLLALVKKHLNDRKTLCEIENVLIYVLKTLSITNTFLIEQEIFKSVTVWINARVAQEFSVVKYRAMINKLHIFYGLVSNIVNRSNLSAFRESVEGAKDAMTARIFSEMESVFKEDIEGDANRLEHFLVSLDEFLKLNDIKENLYVILENMLRTRQPAADRAKSNERMESYTNLARQHEKGHLVRAEVDYRYFLHYSSKIAKIRAKFGRINKLLNNTVSFKRVDKIVRRCEADTIKEFVKNIKNKSTEHNLMTIMKLKEMYFLNKETLALLDPNILKCKVTLFFLCNALQVDEPRLNESERNRVNEIYAQFSCLKEV